MRRAAKTDDTQTQIVNALRKAGCSVFVTPLGDGFPDLVCAYRGYTALVECKTGGKKLNEIQKAFYVKWQGKIVVANTPEKAVHGFFMGWAANILHYMEFKPDTPCQPNEDLDV